MSLGGLIPDLQLLITVEGVGGKEKKKKKGSCFPRKRCNSHSVWRLSLKLVIPGEGVLFMLSLFPRLCHNPFTRTVESDAGSAWQRL